MAKKRDLICMTLQEQQAGWPLLVATLKSLATMTL